MENKVMWIVIVALVIVSGLVGSRAYADSELLTLTNAERKVPLIETKELDANAKTRVDWLCEHKQFSHEGWAGFFTDIPSQTTGENLARNFKDVKTMHAALMASPTHKANILNPVYKYFGTATSCGITVEFFESMGTYRQVIKDLQQKVAELTAMLKNKK